MPYDHKPANQPTPAFARPQPPADDVIDDDATASKDGNAVPVHHASAEPAGPLG